LITTSLAVVDVPIHTPLLLQRADIVFRTEQGAARACKHPQYDHEKVP
jgi:hypothetical protein